LGRGFHREFRQENHLLASNLPTTVGMTTAVPARLFFRGLIDPVGGKRVVVGLNPITPQNAAGLGIDPATSLATLKDTHPDATNAASPPDEPAGVRDKSQGFKHAPKCCYSIPPALKSASHCH
jgi:hypothetical protein